MRPFIQFFILIAGITVNAQSDYQFDYTMEYTDNDGKLSEYYINTKDASYILLDSDYQQIIKEDFVINFNVSMKGETRITDVLPDQFENNPTKIEVVENGKTETVINGHKCKKYVYKTFVIKGEDIEQKVPITYEFYIMDDPLNTLANFNHNEALFPDSLKFDGFPKGTLVMFKNLESDDFSEYTHLTLSKVKKLEKPLKINITNQQVTKFLIKNQSK